MENAGRGIQPRDVRDLCRFYNLSQGVQDELVRFAVEAQRPGWWHDIRTFDEQVTTFIGLETAAQTVRGADALRLPGLLQTHEFAAALLDGIRPPSEKTKQWLADTLSARSKRQERVQNGEVQLHAVMDEAALRRPVGGRQAMAGQVKRLLADAARPNVTLQLIPFDYGPHPGLEGSFQILGFPPGQLGEIVYVEGMVGNFVSISLRWLADTT